MFFLNPSLYNSKQSVLFQMNAEKPVISSLTLTLKDHLKTPVFYQIIDKNNFAFIDVTACDNLDNEKRFTLIYNFFNYSNRTRLLLRQYLTYLNAPITAVNVFPGALPAEREVYDLFGIFFHDHPDLRRILTDYSFTGHPLKKDYPLAGYSEISYSVLRKL